MHETHTHTHTHTNTHTHTHTHTHTPAQDRHAGEPPERDSVASRPTRRRGKQLLWQSKEDWEGGGPWSTDLAAPSVEMMLQEELGS